MTVLNGGARSLPRRSVVGAGRITTRCRIGPAAALDERRGAEGVTWPELGELLRCTPSRLSGLRSARFAVAMSAAMRLTQWLGRPAADFVEVSRW